MITLLDVELRRAIARRLVRVTALLSVAGILIAAVVVFLRTSDLPERSAQEREALIQQCLRNIDDEIEFRFEGGELPEEFRRDICEQNVGHLMQRDPRYHLRSLPGLLGGFTVPLVIGAWLFGASLIGAEWRAGTMTTHLTWEARRVRVMLAKALAAVILGMLFYLGFQALLGLSLLPSALLHGTTDGFDLASTVRLVLRGTLLAAVGAMIGFALGSLGRNTTVAMTAGFIYLAVLEGPLLGNLFPGIRRWLVVGNSIVLMAGVDPEITGRGQVAAAVLLLVYGIVAVALAVAAFRARDVTA